MGKKNTKKIQGVEKDAEEAKKDIFESKYDPISRRVSYIADFRDHFCEELSFISGALDMIYLITDGDLWGYKGDEVAFVIMDARDRARLLRDVL